MPERYPRNILRKLPEFEVLDVMRREKDEKMAGKQKSGARP
jgi:hypothetical protein